MWDTGTSVGNISAISKTVNNVDIKQNRPYRVVAASEDFVSYFYEGPPFKFKSQLKVLVFNISNVIRLLSRPFV